MAAKHAIALLGLGTLGTGGIAAGVMLSRGNGEDSTNTLKPLHTPPRAVSSTPTSPANTNTIIHLNVDGDNQLPADPEAIKYTKMQKEHGQSWNLPSMSDNNFFLKPFGCFSHTFSDVMVYSYTWKDWYSEGGSADNAPETLTPKTTPQISDAAEGCVVMQLEGKKQEFLFRSEITLKRGNLGMVLWTGIKSYDPLENENPRQRKASLLHMLLFLEGTSSENSANWNIKGGYAWGGKDHQIPITSVTIQSPDETGINQTINSSTTDAFNQVYVGLWKSGSGSDKVLNMTAEANTTSTPQALSITHKPLQVKGYKTPIGFFDLNHMTSNPWRTHANINAASSIEAWNNHFKDLMGTWISAEEYCKGKETAESICNLEES